MNAAGLERRHARYTGRVQGVGFRFAAHQIAQSYAVTGFVKNVPDGSVEIVAEGMPEELDRFLAEVAEAMGDKIHGADVHTAHPTEEFPSFEVAY
jgi:acylphosphatase